MGEFCGCFEDGLYWILLEFKDGGITAHEAKDRIIDLMSSIISARLKEVTDE